MTEEIEARIEKLERENRILKKRLARSEENRVIMEESKERYDTLYQSVIRQLDEQQTLLSEKNQMLENLSGKLSKYLSPQVYSSIFVGTQTVEIASKRKKLTVFFSDIVGFTETTDNLEAEELSTILNRYLTEMSKIALEYGATIDKYIGDAMVLFFGDPETKGTKEDAKACVIMAVAMQRRMRELEQEWRDGGLDRPFQIRIGISTGFCTVGNFGSQDRMDYTIIGSGVNLAARLEASAEPGGILIAHETYSLAGDIVMAEEQPPLTVKGFDKPIHCYKIVGIYDDLIEEGKIIRKEQDGVKVVVDLTKREKSGAIRVLEEVLSQLRG
jgi:class 3 adenylate cyclase